MADTDIEVSWAQIAEEEQKAARRAGMPGVLLKMCVAISKHKWAYPFKKPVTDKEVRGKDARSRLA